jgi:2-keto-3-deoxy-L-rhamnonate aldolase RhmA
MRPNRLRDLMRAGRPSLGTRLQNQWPTMIELVGHSRMFDYVEILAEYAPYSLFTLENVGRAIELFDMSGLIKIEQESRLHLAVRAISSGIQNCLFTDIRARADAEECVRAVRAETPATGGLHGVGQGRDVGIVLDVGSPAFVQALEDAVVALMIEKRQAIENLPDILSVPGVDMVQFGPADYALSIGKPGQRSDAEVIEARTYMIKTALEMGITPRAEISSPDEAEYYLNLGVRHFCMGTDVALLFRWYKENGARMRDVLRNV